MKIAERILYAAAGVHFSAAFLGLGVDRRTIYYGSFVVGAVAAIGMALAWSHARRARTNGD